MILPGPRVIAVDDDLTHLRGLAEGLNRSGTACLQVHFTGDLTWVKKSPHVRIIFADLHLAEGLASEDQTKHFQ